MQGDATVPLHHPPMLEAIMSNRSQRISQEVLLLAVAFGEANFDEVCFTWVHIPRYTLPGRWNRGTTALLIELPRAYPQVGPNGFYLDRGLRDRWGRTPDHYFEENDSYSKYAHLGWAWYCLHQEASRKGGWRASTDMMEGDNLLKYVELIRAILSRKGR